MKDNSVKGGAGGSKKEEPSAKDTQEPQVPEFLKKMADVLAIVFKLRTFGYAGYITVANDRFILQVNRALSPEQEKLEPAQQQAIMLGIGPEPVSIAGSHGWRYEASYLQNGILVQQFFRLFSDAA